jgi:hypothetical protein
VVELDLVDVLYVLDVEPIYWEHGKLFLRAAVDVETFDAEREPAACRQIYCFSDVKTRGETRVVCSRQCEDELARLLQCFVNFHSALSKVGWRDHGHDVHQNVRVLLEDHTKFLFDCLLELFAVRIRDAVPHLWLSPVAVIDGAQHQVFVMPAESGVLHADVEPRYVDAADVVLARKLHQRVGLIRQVVQVPGVVHVLHLTSIHKLLAASSEARAELQRADVCCVLHTRLTTFAVLHLVPVFALNCFEVYVSGVSFSFLRDLCKLHESVSFLVLFESLALS